MKKNLFILHQRAFLVLSAVLALLISGCGSNPSYQSSRAPVEDRASPNSRPVAVTPTTQSASSGGGYHTVNRGETLYSISKLYNVTVPALVSANQLTDANQISVGQRLVIPGAGGRTTIVQGGNTSVTTETVSTDGPRETGMVNSSSTKPANTVSTSTSTSATQTKPAVSGSGDWIWPVAGGKVITRFGANGAKGIEISAPLGTPVVAADAGKVIFSSNNIRGYGNLIVLRHNSEYLTAYGYNSRLLVKEGDTVKRGDKIAEVGSSGTDSPKLHFEVRNPQSKPEDPLLFLPKQ